MFVAVARLRQVRGRLARVVGTMLELQWGDVTDRAVRK
jgi:hypothetical protein